MDPDRMAIKFYQAGALLGLVAGLLMFVNLPSLRGVVVNTTLLVLLSASAGHVFDRRNFYSVGLTALLLLPVLFFTGFLPAQCTTEQVIHPPARNLLTGEVHAGGYEPFRVNPCDKQRYPWYIKELPRERLQPYCMENPGDSYCEMLARQREMSWENRTG
ncbi:MAG: hypothetical protein ABEJ07_02175 [Candidatus Nanohaloarchaea archaeon]